jgi:hypothetical protein
MNPYDHRPITFNGEQLAPAMMAVSIIECLTTVPEDLAVWLWRLPICCGVEKSSHSDVAIRAASFARDSLLEHRDIILRGIAERLPDYDAGEVYRQWMEGFGSIITPLTILFGSLTMRSALSRGGRRLSLARGRAAV